jgi:predicted chitinase
VTPAEARAIAALPVAQRGPVLFNRVYGVGNPKKMREFNNTGPNDGWLYRGGGMMQATGKSNYAAMEKKTGLPLVAHPELLHQPDSAFTAAYLEWAQDGRCNAAADRDDVVAVRRIINGGSNGLAECRKFLGAAKRRWRIIETKQKLDELGYHEFGMLNGSGAAARWRRSRPTSSTAA